MEPLTERQQQVLDFVSSYLDTHGCPPTLREISEHIKTKGTVTAIRHLDALERKGYIQRRAGSSRSITVAGRSAGTVSVPIAGIQYKEDIEKDMVTLENLKHIVSAVIKDIESEKVGASTELLLRIAANDFKNKLALIPEKKTLRKEIMKSLKEVHSDLLHQTAKERH